MLSLIHICLKFGVSVLEPALRQHGTVILHDACALEQQVQNCPDDECAARTLNRFAHRIAIHKGDIFLIAQIDSIRRTDITADF